MSIQASESLHHLFGGTCSWDFDSWHASDDRVRGGKSQSHLEAASPSASGATHQNARFFGDLDITALGGAGFASQRTADSKSWDLSPYSGLSIKIVNGDGKKYTLILKDEILPKRPDGREQSTISWEYDFVGEQSELRISWADFKPTYRGKAKPDADPLDLTGIKLLSIMMRRQV
ncbi:complex I intermediate-associated protein 30 [Microdochium trichocladiopsis]|uniref:Complex I intermediate-associated protein 30 n=1 Tax=Microdochium trichocladiopsis TaxID=1682393 RepID=A0A9P9BVH4_9PEZI|nr:complex I intermediate-associated protein 30 [Microdochium trichocladiopsis]KAH7040273.1 complex I intermediate-associated protein 30 [Microdochium trichocladiopsis]